MERLPENARVILESLLEDLKSRESVSAVGLFGSYSRGDSVLSSDVDLLIVDKREFDYEYVERAMLEDVFFDLEYVPEKKILKQMAPELDHKMFEGLPVYGYTVFGRVVDGMDVADAIGMVATGAGGPFESEVPVEPVIIERVDPIEWPQD